MAKWLHGFVIAVVQLRPDLSQQDCPRWINIASMYAACNYTSGHLQCIAFLFALIGVWELVARGCFIPGGTGQRGW